MQLSLFDIYLKNKVALKKLLGTISCDIYIGNRE